MIKYFLLFMTMVCTLPLSAAERPVMAVMNVTVQDSVMAPIAATLSDIVAAEVEKTGLYTVLSMSDQQAMLAHQGLQQAIGSGNDRDLAGLAEKMGAAWLLAGHVGRTGDNYILTFKIIENGTAKVLRRVSREHAGDENGLVKETKNAMAELFANMQEAMQPVQKVSMKDMAAQAKDKLKIAVMDLGAKQGVSPQAAASLTDLATDEIATIGRYDVINRDDIRVMLEHMANRQLLDCDDTRCLAVIGGALGVDYLFSGNIGKVGNRYVINLKVIDIENAEVLTRVSGEYNGNESDLVDHLKHAIDKLFDEGRLFRQKLLKWSVAGGAAVAAGAGGYFAWRGQDIYANEYLVYDEAGDPGVGYDNAVRLKSDVEEMDLYRNISLGVSSLLTGTAYYLFKKF